jgi:hypothetical protein
MFRLLFLLLLLMVVLQYFEPWLKRFKFGRLPGDLSFILFKRVWYLPITSAFLVCLALELLSKVF